MAQGNKPEAGLPGAYRVIEAGGLVVLAKPLPSGAGYYPPFAVLRLQDLPEELRRQIAAARPREARAAAPVAAPLRGQGAARRYHAAGPVDVVPQGLRRQLPGLVSGPNDVPAVGFGGDGISSDAVNEYSECRIMPAAPGGGRDGKVAAAYMDASRLQVLGDMEGSLLGQEEGFSHAWTEHSADEVWARGVKYKVVANDYSYSSEPSNMAAQRAAHADMGVFDGNGLPVPGNDRAAECGGVYYYDVLVPPENVLPAAGEASRACAVQVLVDAAAGGKAGDPIAAGGVEAAGVDAGHEHGNLLGVLGIVVTSSAATALAAGTVCPATAFGLFVALVGGLSLAMASVRARLHGVGICMGLGDWPLFDC